MTMMNNFKYLLLLLCHRNSEEQKSGNDGPPHQNDSRHLKNFRYTVFHILFSTNLYVRTPTPSYSISIADITLLFMSASMWAALKLKLCS